MACKEMQNILNTAGEDLAIVNKYNYLINFINFSLPQIVSAANEKIIHKCFEVRPNHKGLVGWYLGSKKYNCYKTSYYLLPDEQIAGLNYFIDNQNPVIDLSPASSDQILSEKDYDDIRLLSVYVLLFSDQVGLADKLTNWLYCSEIPS